MIAAVINISALILVLFSFFKNREKTKQALKIAVSKGLGLAPQLISLVALTSSPPVR